ncbi:MAG: response regulator transcription factor [Hespellia sp.]|nr:response regulator transcription factor [Hespellia sp.]
MYRILLIDDDTILLSAMKKFFEKREFEVFCATEGKAALQMAKTIKLDCIVLDIQLPDTDGFTLCEQLRSFTTLPLIFLSSFTEEEAKLRGFRLGADDYVCKPFSPKELEARICLRIQRRFDTPVATILTFDGLSVNLTNRTVTYGTHQMEFTSIEFDILAFFVQHPNQLFSYEQLYDGIWKEPLGKSLHNLQARIASVRQKLLELCPDREYIQTIRRKGYLFKA